MQKTIMFLSRDANWQQYRLEVLSKLSEEYDYKVEILTIGELKQYLQDNNFVKYKKFLSFFPLNWSLNFFPGALLYILKNKPDYVLALPNATNLTEFIAVPLCKIFNIPIVFWTHGYDHIHRRNNIINIIRIKIIEYFLKKVDHVFTFSKKGKNYLISKGILANNITVAPNTLNTDMWLKKFEKCNKSQLRKEYGYKNNDLLLLFSGRIHVGKKVNHLLYALEYIQKEYKNFNIHLNIVGDGLERESLEEYTTQHNLDNITFHGFVFDESKVSELFCMSDLFVMPGSVGLAIVHAFCFGLPVITETQDFHSPEIQYLYDDINGYFIEEGNIKELVKKLIYLYENRDKLSELSTNAHATASKDASIHNMVKMMHNGFEKIKT